MNWMSKNLVKHKHKNEKGRCGLENGKQSRTLTHGYSSEGPRILVH